jgi:4-hydroxy-L-threonine phosphate dehydrogenase PdxA
MVSNCFLAGCDVRVVSLHFKLQAIVTLPVAGKSFSAAGIHFMSGLRLLAGA